MINIIIISTTIIIIMIIIIKIGMKLETKKDKETCLMCELFTIFPTLVINHAFHPNILLASFVSREENIQYIFSGMDFLYLKEI